MKNAVWYATKLVTLAFIAAVLAIFIFAVPPTEAQQGSAAAEAYYSETITVAATAIGATAAQVRPATSAGATTMFCSVQAQSIRYRYDGFNPTAAIGHPADAGATIVVYGTNNIRRFRAIAQSTAASLFCTLAR